MADQLSLEEQMVVSATTALLFLSPGRADCINASLRIIKLGLPYVRRDHARLGPIAEAVDKMMACSSIEDVEVRRRTYGRHAAEARIALSNLYLWRAGQAELRIEDLASDEAPELELVE